MAGYKLTTDVIGADELKAAFLKAPEVVARNLKDAVGKTAFSVEGKAKSYAPIQYGNLRGSIHTEGPTVLSTNVEAAVGTNVKYALWQEKGTGIYAGKGPITPKSKKFLAWKQNGKWIFARQVKGIKPKLFFKKARTEALPLLEANLKAAMANITTFLAKG